MNTDAGRHAILIAIAVFGGAAIWLGLFILLIKKQRKCLFPSVVAEFWVFHQH